MKIALVSSRKEEKFAQGVSNDEDNDLIDFLTNKGLDVVLTIWNNEEVNWHSFDLVVIKSPWDYHNHLNAFLDWLDKIDSVDVKVLNPVEVIKWNSHKLYLKDLINIDLPVIPTEYLEKDSAFDGRFFDLFTIEKLVVKPCVSAGAQNTITVTKENLKERTEEIAILLQERDYMVQPFVEEIKNGE